jgi:hypothetical protein
MGEETKKIINEILESLDINQEEKERLGVQMSRTVLERIFLETMEKLDDSGKGEYQKLTESGSATPEQVEEFLKSKINDYDGLVQKVVDEFKEEMKTGVNS